MSTQQVKQRIQNKLQRRVQKEELSVIKNNISFYTTLIFVCYKPHYISMLGIRAYWHPALTVTHSLWSLEWTCVVLVWVN